LGSLLSILVIPMLTGLSAGITFKTTFLAGRLDLN
jgi:hypothetical protein